jgi:hypothetical protein
MSLISLGRYSFKLERREELLLANLSTLQALKILYWIGDDVTSPVAVECVHIWFLTSFSTPIELHVDLDKHWHSEVYRTEKLSSIVVARAPDALYVVSSGASASPALGQKLFIDVNGRIQVGSSLVKNTMKNEDVGVLFLLNISDTQVDPQAIGLAAQAYYKRRLSTIANLYNAAKIEYSGSMAGGTVPMSTASPDPLLGTCEPFESDFGVSGDSLVVAILGTNLKVALAGNVDHPFEVVVDDMLTDWLDDSGIFVMPQFSITTSEYDLMTRSIVPFPQKLLAQVITAVAAGALDEIGTALETGYKAWKADDSFCIPEADIYVVKEKML